MPAQTTSLAVLSQIALEARIQHLRTTAEIARELEVSLKQVRGALRDLAESGIHIPRLCHVGGLSSPAACRLCLVEVDGQPKLRASCITEAVEGMVVRTATPESLSAARTTSS